MPILTATQSKAAREALGLSQAKVARETGVNRSTLALFEVDRYLLPEPLRATLRAFYMSRGYIFKKASEAISHTHTGLAHHNAVRFPGHEVGNGEDNQGKHAEFVGCSDLSATETDEAKALLERLYANDLAIKELMVQPVKRDWFDDIKPEPADKAIALMALNYLLIRQLQGHNLLPSATSGSLGKAKTYADVVYGRLKG